MCPVSLRHFGEVEIAVVKLTARDMEDKEGRWYSALIPDFGLGRPGWAHQARPHSVAATRSPALPFAAGVFSELPKGLQTGLDAQSQLSKAYSTSTALVYLSFVAPLDLQTGKRPANPPSHAS